MADVLIRSMSGYIFIIPIVLLYYIYLKKKGKKQTLPHIITVLVFCYYIIGVLTMTGIGKLHSFSPRMVLIPFADMLKGPIDTILNILLFVPLGLLLPFLYKKYRNTGSIALTGFLFSLSIEILQMFGRGATDINDLITNTAGAVLGYLLYKLLIKITKKVSYEKFQSDRNNDYIEVMFFIIISFIIMVTIQPLIISKLFKLG